MLFCIDPQILEPSTRAAGMLHTSGALAPGTAAALVAALVAIVQALRGRHLRGR